jgi:hypothetical protein
MHHVGLEDKLFHDQIEGRMLFVGRLNLHDGSLSNTIAFSAFIGTVKLPDQRSAVLPDGRSLPSGKERKHFQIASLRTNQRLGALPDGSAAPAGSGPTKKL